MQRCGILVYGYVAIDKTSPEVAEVPEWLGMMIPVAGHVGARAFIH